MSSNNHALVRYRTIDQCLKSRDGQYFVKDLIKECSDAVHEYEVYKSKKEKKFSPISRRTLMYDLKFMKDDVYGFGAPIMHDKKEGYYYDDPNYQAFKAKISDPDKVRLSEALAIMKDLCGNNQFKDLEETVLRIENTYKIYNSRADAKSIQFEKSTNVLGIKWLSAAKEKIRTKQTLRIEYRPFGGDTVKRIISPYLLKEYNNRWFLIGYDHENKSLTNLGLDRVKKIHDSIIAFYKDPSFHLSSYSKDIVGVSIPANSTKQTIKIKALGRQKYYLDTKPFHHSQEMIKEEKDFAIFQLEVIPNFELQSKILANADTLEVISPKSFKDLITSRITRANGIYSK